MVGCIAKRWIHYSLVGLLCAFPAYAGEPASQETGPDPGELAVSFETKGSDYLIRQYALRSLAQLSYLVGSAGEALLVDPQRDVEPYLRDAESLGLRITKVVLTHTHADFVAGHTELSRRVKASVVTAADLELGWSGLEHGALTVEARPLEGGPRDGLLLRVRGGSADAAPTWVFTGDAVLVGTVGCPEDVDLGVPAVNLAEQVRDAVQALQGMSDETRILPAHGDGPFGGRLLAPYTRTSLARERVANPFFAVSSRAAFLGRVLDLQVSAPAPYAAIARTNRAGPALVNWSSRPVEIEAAELPPQAQGWVLDVRSQADYAAGHVLGAVNIPLRGAFEPWVAAVVPHEAPLVLVGSEHDVGTAVRRLHRIGYRATAVLAGGMAAWTAAGHPVAHSALVRPQDLARRRAAEIEPLLVDVRSAGEYRTARIAGCVNVPLVEAGRLSGLLQPDTRCLMICKTGYRSGIAVGLAERMGIVGADNLAGGIRAWRAAGLPLLPAPSGAGKR